MPGNRRIYGRQLKVTQPNVCSISGKRGFATRESAEAELVAAQRLRTAQRNPHVENRFYLCVSCLKFHLTSEGRKR